MPHADVSIRDVNNHGVADSTHPGIQCKFYQLEKVQVGFRRGYSLH